MISTKNLNINQLARIYVMANTPTYLFRHYRADFSVQDLAREHSVAELVNSIFEVESIPANERTEKQIIGAYACIVALTFKEYEEVKTAINGRVLSNLVWADDIFSLWEATSAITKTIKVTQHPTLQKPTRSSDVNTFSTTI